MQIKQTGDSVRIVHICPSCEYLHTNGRGAYCDGCRPRRPWHDLAHMAIAWLVLSLAIWAIAWVTGAQ